MRYFNNEHDRCGENHDSRYGCVWLSDAPALADEEGDEDPKRHEDVFDDGGVGPDWRGVDGIGVHDAIGIRRPI